MLTDHNSKIENSSSDEFTPFGCLAVLLYTPALSFSIRLGIYTYWHLFGTYKGVYIIFGILVTIVITLIYMIIALGFVNLLYRLGNNLWLYLQSIIKARMKREE